MASNNPSNKNAASSINELERAQQVLGRAQELPGRADPGTGQLAPSTTTPSSNVPAATSMDTLNAYIQTNDNQRAILDQDQHFLEFQRANPWARTASDSAMLAALEVEFDQRIRQFRREVEQALERGGNTDPVQVRPFRLDAEAPEFRPRQPSLSQGGHSRQGSQASPLGGRSRQVSQSSLSGGHLRHVSHGSQAGGHGRQASSGSQTGGHGRQGSEGGQFGGQGRQPSQGNH